MSSLLIVTLCLLVGTSVHAIPSFTRNYTSSQQLLSDYTIFWRVNQTSQEIYLGFQVQTIGWFGFGIAEPDSGSMPGADIMTAYVSGSKTSVTDRFSTATALPPVDTACQDWQVVSGAEADGWTVVEVTRKLDTGDDKQDRVIPSGSVAVIFSHSMDNTDDLSYHGSNRGVGFITFYGTPQPIASDLLLDPNGNVTVAFPRITGFQIPAQQTTYMCQSFQLPVDQIRHIIAFEPVIDAASTSFVHHTVIHGCAMDSDFWTQYQTPGQCISPVGDIQSKCSDILFAWARGGQSMFLPQEAGYRVSNGTDGYYKIILQMHYDNPSLIANAVDHSGFKFYMTTQLRPHDAGVIVLGDPFTSSAPIPAGSTYTEYEYACSPTCTSTWQMPLQVFSSFPHMHMKGQRIWTTRWRNGTQLEDSVNTEYFSWTIQKNIPVNYTIIPGDRMNTHCGYGPTSTTVTFGKNSTQEMCMEFISYYPKQTNVLYCGAYRDVINRNHSVCNTGVNNELNNPAQWGYDPQRLRTFGTDMMDTTICPSTTTTPTTGTPTTPTPTPTTSSPTTPIPTTSSPTTPTPTTSTPTTPTPLSPNSSTHIMPTIIIITLCLFMSMFFAN